MPDDYLAAAQAEIKKRGWESVHAETRMVPGRPNTRFLSVRFEPDTEDGFPNAPAEFTGKALCEIFIVADLTPLEVMKKIESDAAAINFDPLTRAFRPA